MFVKKYYLNCFVLFLVVFIFSVKYLFGQTPEDLFFKSNNKQSVKILSDKMDYDKKMNIISAWGSVSVISDTKTLKADSVRLNNNTKQLYASGNVMMTAGSDILTGDAMDLDIDAQTGVIYNGIIFLQASHFYIKGDRIEKRGKSSYFINKGSLTSCDGDSPDWKISATDVDVTIGGYGHLNNAVLWAKNIPVLYSPFMFFPLKQKRQTGFLTPGFGFSNRKGFEYLQPFYWEINESSDLTVYEHFMGYRGIKSGVEYRYVRSEVTKGTCMFDFLNDSKLNDAFDIESEWGYDHDSYMRTNRDRYWFRMKHDQKLAFGWFGKIDMDIVSDQDYLREFQSGYSGFDKTEKYFLNEFMRQIDSYDSVTRVNSIYAGKFWGNYFLNTEIRWYDNVLLRSSDETDTTLQKLPYIEFGIIKNQLYNSRLYYDMNSEYTWFYSKDGIKGYRADIYPRIYMPFYIADKINIEPSAGYRSTLWQMDEKRDHLYKDFSQRGIYDFRLDAYTDLYKIFDTGFSGIDKIKHTVRPQIIYNYIPEQDQGEYPYFDYVDRVAKTNLITYSVTNTFTARSSKVKLDSENIMGPVYTYNQFCRLKLEQSYDINREKDENEEKPFYPLYAELLLTPFPGLSVTGDARWDVYGSFFVSHNISAGASTLRGDLFFIEHRYGQNINESLFFDLSLVISDKISVFGVYEHDLLNDIDVERSAGFKYSPSCWSLTFKYVDKEDERQYFFLINLNGIGGFGEDLEGSSIESAW